MTADIAGAEAAGEPTTPHPASPAVRWHLGAAVAFLLLASAGTALVSLQLVWPDLGAGVPQLSYGRMLPAAWSGFLYGWLTIGFLGAAYHIVPRLAGVAPARTLLSMASLILVAGGVLGGTVAVSLGMSQGRPLLEMPIWADAVALAGFLLAAWVLTSTAARGRDRMGPATWYLLAASWWLPLAWLVGNLPGIAGYGGAIQSAFYRASITGLWFVAAGVGVVYYLVPRLVGSDPRRHTRLSALGFWSLALAWVGTAASDVVYGAGPDWYETLGVAFSIALVVPVVVVVVDLGTALRGSWSAVAHRTTLRFVVAGTFLFLLVPFAELVQALRTSSAVVQFTSWVTGNDHLVFHGALSLWLFAFAYHALNDERPRVGAGPAWHVRYTLAGLGVALVAMWSGGLVAGFTWAAGANSDLVTSHGEGFFNTTVPQQPFVVARAVGMVVFAAAQLIFAVVAFRRRDGEVLTLTGHADDYDLDFWGPPREPSWNRLRYGSVALFAVAALVLWLLPSLDPALSESTLLADRFRVYTSGSAEAAGRQVYLSEGCWYCHTQEVRPVVTDVDLGPVSLAGDYVHESPILRGVERVGPDLMHAGSREPAGSYRFVFAHLQDPRATRPWSNMPSYTYLSEAELDALAQYVVGLE